MALSLSSKKNKNWLNEEIEMLRKKLHKAILNNQNREIILKLSQDLDKLINLYHNENKK